MSSTAYDKVDEFVCVARALRTRGLKGEIVAELLTDFPKRFESIKELIASSPVGAKTTLELESFWFQNDRIILKFVGVDTVEAARELTGYEFCVPETERIQLDENEYYDFDLVDCAVHSLHNGEIGKVQSVLRTGGPEILVIAAGDGHEILVPLAQDIVVRIDVEKKEIVIDPPEGLLELS